MRPNLPALTSIRSLAAWWVVVYHFRTELPASWHVFQSFARHGYLAVDLFFLMSGFVIALNYEHTVKDLQWRSVARFLGLRLARIYPLHAAILLAYLANPIAIALFSQTGSVGARYDPGYYILSFFLVQNWGFTPALAWNIPAWSISTEWFSYLLFPIVAWVSVRAVSGVAFASLTIGGGLLALAGLGHAVGSLDNNIAQVGLLRCVLGFSVGVAFYRLWLACGQRGFFGNAATVLGLVLIVSGIALAVPDYLFAPSGFALLMLGFVDERCVSARLLAHPWLIAAGEASYSTYMCHFLLKDWVKFAFVGSEIPIELVFALYLTMVAASSVLLYHLIEIPGRRLGRSWVEAWCSRHQPAN